MSIGDVLLDACTIDGSAALRSGLTQLLGDTLSPWQVALDDLGQSRDAIVEEVFDLAAGDLLALTRRDPASRQSWHYVIEAYACYRAVLAHRLAHAVLTGPAEDSWRALILARQLSETARVRTGVEIHPAASIGPRFVVDHGTGTVIGEDVTIGADCYILQGVVLGAMGIANNPSGRRHPRLGDRVQVGGFARILGPVEIGDDVLVGSHAMIRTDVPAGCRVTTLNQYQVVSGPKPIVIYGVEALGEHRFRLHGVDLDRTGIEVDLLSPSHVPLAAADVHVLQRNARCMTVQIAPRAYGLRSVTHLRVRQGGSAVTVGIPHGRRSRTPALARSA